MNSELLMKGKKSDQGGIETSMWEGYLWHDDMERNQTKVGLKQGGIRSFAQQWAERNQTKVGLKHLIGRVFNRISVGKKSDQGGIETV